MAKTPVRDAVIWAKHIHGDDGVVAHLQSLRGGDTVDLVVDGVRGVWCKMADGKDGRSTSGIRPIGSAQDFWKELAKARRGDLVEVELASPEPESRPVIYPALGPTMEERLAAIQRFFELGKMGFGSEDRTMTRDEMHER
jgi:hypothetical protein